MRHIDMLGLQTGKRIRVEWSQKHDPTRVAVSIDLEKSFFQVPIPEDLRNKSTFIALGRIFQMCRLTVGFKNAVDVMRE